MYVQIKIILSVLRTCTEFAADNVTKQRTQYAYPLPISLNTALHGSKCSLNYSLITSTK